MTVITTDRPPPDYKDPDDERLLTPYSKLVDREEAYKRETTILPLTTINWELYATVEEALNEAGSRKQWIPYRFSERQERLRLYRSLYDGNIKSLIPDPSYARVMVNEFRQACLFTSDILTSVEITPSVEIFNAQVLENAISLAIVMLERDGIALLNTGVDEAGEPFITTVDPSCWFPRRDGGHILYVPYVSDEADTPRYDRAIMTIIEPEGETVEYEFEYQSDNSKGRLIETRPVVGLNFVTPIYRAPTVPGWGTSLFDDLAPIVLEHTIRMTSYSKILNANENPLLNIFLTKEDMPDFGGSDTEEKSDWEAGVSEVAMNRGKQAALDYRDQNVAVGLDSQTKLQYLTWDGNLDASAAYIEMLEQQISKITGIPKVLQEGAEVASGVALKRLYQKLYSATLSILNAMKYGLENALTAMSTGEVTVEWPHPFDFDDLEASADDDNTPPGESEDDDEAGASGSKDKEDGDDS